MHFPTPKTTTYVQNHHFDPPSADYNAKFEMDLDADFFV
jgi:hypothetical protein